MKTIISNSFKKHYNTFQMILAFTLLALIILTPLFSLFIEIDNKQIWLTVEVTALAVFCSLLFRLFIQNSSKQKTTDQPSKPENLTPPILFENYIHAQTTIKESIREFLNNNENIHIQIMGVAMQYSWKILIEDELPKLLKLGNEKQKITVDLYVVQPDHLLKWNQKDLVKYSKMCVDCTPEILNDFNENFDQDRISINVYQYDNIPHRHGILINNTVLFRSKCSFSDQGKLLVGQNGYKMFKTGEQDEAIDSIELFNNWAFMYRERHNLLALEPQKK